ncbi:ester cyclase [Streptomyces sp. NBC_01142]|uniref:ester cyclase n=1 Tax=Streptomyces sp. NBC_01142 TaxID=2975865 RepID=UPI002256DA18|nr:ester cyclase [Streptomyces sp. NBC_01142]MCX4818792.1 ester cyclase [Streptomyces sp. NBC_01142]
MKFVQIIDYKTERFDGMNQLMDKWVEQTQGKRTATHSVIGKDRSDGSHYVEIVEFGSYEEAMKNSHLPETDRIFQEMVALCDGMPSFTDLDIVRDEQLNTATARRFFHELAVGGNLDAIDEVFAADYRDHDILKEEETVIGSDIIRQDLTRWRAAFDFTFNLDDQIAQGDNVATRWTWTGTHQGDFMGIPPTGKVCTMTGNTIFRFHDGMIQEGWWHYDAMRLMRQLGAL